MAVRLGKITIGEHEIQKKNSVKKDKEREEDTIMTKQVHWAADGVLVKDER